MADVLAARLLPRRTSFHVSTIGHRYCAMGLEGPRAQGTSVRAPRWPSEEQSAGILLDRRRQAIRCGARSVSEKPTMQSFDTDSF